MGSVSLEVKWVMPWVSSPLAFAQTTSAVPHHSNDSVHYHTQPSNMSDIPENVPPKSDGTRASRTTLNGGWQDGR